MATTSLDVMSFYFCGPQVFLTAGTLLRQAQQSLSEAGIDTMGWAPPDPTASAYPGLVHAACFIETQKVLHRRNGKIGARLPGHFGLFAGP